MIQSNSKRIRKRLNRLLQSSIKNQNTPLKINSHLFYLSLLISIFLPLFFNYTLYPISSYPLLSLKSASLKSASLESASLESSNSSFSSMNLYDKVIFSQTNQYISEFSQPFSQSMNINNDNSGSFLINPNDINNSLLGDTDNDSSSGSMSNSTTSSGDDNSSSNSNETSSENDENETNEHDEENEDEPSDEDMDEKFKEENDRDSTVSVQDYAFEIESERSTSTMEDSLYYYGEPTDNGIEISMAYAYSTETSESEFSATLLIENVIEYSDINSDGNYTEGVDNPLRILVLNNVQKINYSTITLSTGIIQHHIAWSSIDGSFILHLIYSDGFSTLNDTGDIISPTSLKMDFEITPQFATSNNTYNNARVAVKMELITEQSFEIEEEHETEDEKLGLSKNETALTLLSSNNNNEISPFFSWKDYAIIDGNLTDVIVQSDYSNIEYDSNSNSATLNIYFNYPAANNIYHDPKVGMEGIYIGIPFPNPTDSSTSTSSSTVSTSLLNRLFSWWNSLSTRESFLILGIIIFSTFFLLIMTKQEFRSYLLNRAISHSTGPHRLTMEEVLENEIRNKIINLILDNPGIHYSEIARQVDTSASNLAWHLDILESYKIIHKQRIGQYLIFYPYIENNPFSETHSALVKSKTTLEILGIIGDHPGIIQAQIARRMALNRKSVEYHLKKLLEAGLIYAKQKGRKKFWFAYAKKEEKND